MQTIPTFNIHTLTGQFGKAGDTPHISCNIPFLLQQSCSFDDFPQNRAGPQQLDPLFLARPLFELVDAFDHTCFNTIWHSWVTVVFIHDGDVIKRVFTILIHALHTILQNDGQLVGESGIIGATVWDPGCRQMTVPILVL